MWMLLLLMTLQFLRLQFATTLYKRAIIMKNSCCRYVCGSNMAWNVYKKNYENEIPPRSGSSATESSKTRHLKYRFFPGSWLSNGQGCDSTNRKSLYCLRLLGCVSTNHKQSRKGWTSKQGCVATNHKLSANAERRNRGVYTTNHKLNAMLNVETGACLLQAAS